MKVQSKNNVYVIYKPIPTTDIFINHPQWKWPVYLLL